MHDLLHDNLIGITMDAGQRTVTLPDLLALLAAGQVNGYTALRAHQADPWHVFLVQAAASVLARRPAPKLPTDPTYWREGLLDLADGKATAWHLVVEEVTKPAFLQHPLAGQAELEQDFGVKAATPDQLDILVTAKDHDVKMARAQPDALQAWVFALLTYQTTSGFLGAGNYGSIRMNGGFASRPVVSLINDPQVSRRFIDEVMRLLDIRSSLVKNYRYCSRGIVITWVAPWSRQDHQFQMHDLEPWFIEAARAVRLVRRAGGCVALGSATKARQIGPRSVDSGDVGDPWIPINVEDKKKGRSALTVSGGGWTPKLITRLLFQQGFELTALQKPRDGASGLWFTGSVIVRGQGTTEGFHRFSVPIPPKARRTLLREESLHRLGKLAQELLADASAAERALGTAVMCLAEGGPEVLDVNNPTVDAWAKKVRRDLFQGWEDSYFPMLWRAAETQDMTEIIIPWRAELVAQARQALRDAERRLPLPSARRYRALVRAESVLIGALRKAGLTRTNDQEDQGNAA